MRRSDLTDKKHRTDIVHFMMMKSKEMRRDSMGKRHK